MSEEREADRLPEPSRTGAVAWAIKVAVPVALLAIGTTHYLARQLAMPAADPARLARAGTPDPETTGSLASGARQLRLDPCAVQGSLRGAHP